MRTCLSSLRRYAPPTCNPFRTAILVAMVGIVVAGCRPHDTAGPDGSTSPANGQHQVGQQPQSKDPTAGEGQPEGAGQAEPKPAGETSASETGAGEAAASETTAGEPAAGQTATDPTAAGETTAGGRGAAEDEEMTEHPFRFREPAPSLDGGIEWINAAGPINMRDLRGKFVLLDFWTYCCINCMHILPELKKLEHAYPNQVVVIGVHSAKFDTEKGSENIRQAVLRYDIEHPVVNDADHAIWRRYGITGWPALRVIDPEGQVVAMHGGEVEFETLDSFFKSALPYYKKRGLLDETPFRFDLERDRQTAGPLRFPGKVLADEGNGRLYISDSGHNRIVVTDLDGKLIETIGSGLSGADNGPSDRATFDHPQGMALRDQTLYVADTENHLIRKIDLAGRQVSTIAGTGRQNRGLWPGMDRIEVDETTGKVGDFPDRWVTDPATFPISSPWALAIEGEYLYIAMAGPHQIWRMTLDEKEIEVFAGNGREDIADGTRAPATPPRIDGEGFGDGYASFAQPSGLASDGSWLYVADSEGSAIRAVPFDPDEKVRTVVGPIDMPFGQSLFTFGDEDGQGGDVRLQHALGVVHVDGKLYVADTYNNKIKRIELESRTAVTLAGSGTAGRRDQPAEFDEPGGVSYAAGKLYVADTNNHLIRTIDLKSGQVQTLAIAGLKPPDTARPIAESEFADTVRVPVDAAIVRPLDGQVRLTLRLDLPRGWKINPLGPMRYQVTAKTADGPIDRAALAGTVVVQPDLRSNELTVTLPTNSNSGRDELECSLGYYYCREGAEGVCKVGSVTWTLPLTLSETGSSAPVVLTHQVP